MSRTLTRKQEAFAREYIDNNGNGAKAALKAYDTEDNGTARVIASQNLTKYNVIEYIQSKASKAASNVFTLANKAKNETVRLNANKDILDRAGFRPVERREEVSLHKYEGSIDITHLALQTVEKLKEVRLKE